MNLRLLNGAVLLSVSILVVGILFAPYHFDGYPEGDSYDLNVSWATYFLSQLNSGQPYPRWLTDYVGGIGAPVFYFYAPAPFYLAAAAQVLCPGCGVVTILSATHVLMLVLSGAGFFLWARTLAPASLSLLGALWYMALPYHFIDLTLRDSLGEGMAYVFMPLALLGTSRLAGALGWLCLAAVAYAALILTHLPTALLFTPVMAIFALAHARRGTGRRVALRLVAAGLVGVCLAGIYVVPALALRAHLVTDGWVTASGPWYHPENWLLGGGDPAAIADAFRWLVVRSLGLSTGVALGSLAVLLLIRRLGRPAGPAFARRQGRTVTAAVACVALGWLMMTTATEWLWLNLPPLRQVQFPWRVGTVIELANATIVTVCLARAAVLVPRLRGVPGPMWTNAVYAALVAAMALFLLRAEPSRTDGFRPVPEIVPGAPRGEVPAANLARLHATMPEYVPFEYLTKWIVDSMAYGGPVPATSAVEGHRTGYRRWRARVAALPFLSVAGAPGTRLEHEVRRAGAAAFDIRVSLDRPRSLVLRIAYFPGWSLADRASGRKLAVAPGRAHGLIRFDLPAGTHRLRLERRMLPEERLGAALSAGAALVLLVTLLGARARLPAAAPRRFAPRLPLDRPAGDP